MNNKLVKIIGITSSVVGVAASVAASWVNDKKLDEKIASKVSEAVASKLSKQD